MNTHLEDVFNVTSSENIVDICTTRESNLQQIGPDSALQTGPHWLKEPCYNWPCNKDITIKELPTEKTKTPIKIIMTARVTNPPSSSMVHFVLVQY